MSVRVLVVDDEPDIRLLMSRLLARHDRWEVVGEVADGAEVLDAVRRLEPDVVLLDLHMSTPGDAIVPQLVQQAPSCMITVVSGLPAADNRGRLLRLGAFSYVEKAQLDQLAETLASDYAMFQRALEGEDVLPPWAFDGARLAP